MVPQRFRRDPPLTVGMSVSQPAYARVIPLALVAALGAAHLGGLATFHAADARLPDGDVMGHLGAIESHLYVIDNRGAWPAIVEAFTAGGEYPPLQPLITALLVAAAGAPGIFPHGVAAVDAGVWLATLAAVYALGARRSGPWAGLVAAALWSLCPLALALARAPMPEPWLGLWLSLTALSLDASRGFSRLGPSAAVGASVALGLMTKQTFALYAGPLLLIAAAQALARPGGRRGALAGLAVAAALALPLPLLWLGLHLGDQGAYLSASAGNRSGAPLWHHAAYYPLILVGQALGPFLAALVAAALVGGMWGAPAGPGMRPRRHLIRGGWVGPLLLLTLIPKKYPRLALPLLPLVAVDAGAQVVALIRRGGRIRAATLAALGAALILGAAQAVATGPGSGALSPRFGLWRPALTLALDPGCLQDWIRPAHPGDLGVDALYQAVEAALLPEERRVEPPDGQGRLVLLDQPELPCSYQTTFPLAAHLGPYFRRRGMELGALPVAAEEPELAASLLQGRWAVVVASTAPWRCPAPEGAADLCPWRARFEEAGTFESTDPELPFTWHLYRRRR